MRAYYAILFLTPLTLCASIPRSPVASSNRPTVAPSDRPTVAPSDRPADTWTPPAFDRYAGILKRMPFGQAPAVVAPPVTAASAAPPPPPPALAKLTLCAINRTPAGSIEVGFVDGSTTPPHSYLLNVGDQENGFTAVCANIDQETATIGKDGVNIDLHMGKGPGVGSPKAAPPVAVAVAQPIIQLPTVTATQQVVRSELVPPAPPHPFDPTAWPIPGNVKAIDKALTLGIKQDSYVDRLKKRRDDLLTATQSAATANQPDAANDERITARFEALLRRKNLEMIRSGEGGLGIPLTAEEDAQLVKEGALPAQN